MHEKVYDIKFDCVLIATIFHVRCNFSLLRARLGKQTNTRLAEGLHGMGVCVRSYFYCFLTTFFAKTHKVNCNSNFATPPLIADLFIFAVTNRLLDVL